MEKWMILAVVSLLLGLIDRLFAKTKGALTILSAVLMFSSIGWLLVSGGSSREAITWLLVFLLLNIGERS